MTKKNNDERREGVKRQILEAFFHFRSNLPKEGSEPDGSVKWAIWRLIHE